MGSREISKLRKLLSQSAAEKLNCVVTLKVSWSFAKAIKVAAPSNVSSFVREAVAARLGELVDGK